MTGGMQGRLRCGTDLLTAVAEEVQTHLMRPQQQPALEALSAAANDVLSVLGVALNRALDAPEGALGNGHARPFSPQRPCPCFRIAHLHLLQVWPTAPVTDSAYVH